MFDDTSMLDVVGQRHPLVSDIVRPPMPVGSTVAEIVRAMDLDTARYGLPLVYLVRGAEIALVPVDMWRKTRPKAGTRVEVAFAVPEGGAVLATIASAALPQAASWLAGTVLGLTELAYSLTVAAITIVGSLAINALIPPAQQSGGGGPQNYAITGVANAENRYGVYPTVIGRHRMYPPKTATGYSETIGKDIYYRGRMTFGHGPVALEDLRIGTTPIWEFDGIELEFLNVDEGLTLAAMPELAALVKSRMEETQRPKARLRELGDAYTFTPAAAARTASLEISVTAQREIASLDLMLEVSEVGGSTWSEVQSWAAVSSDVSWTSEDFGTDGIRRRWRLRVTGVTLQAEAGTSQFALLTGLADAATVTQARATYQAEAAGWRHGAQTMRLYPNDVAEDPDNALPDQDDPVVRYTRDESISASVDISFTNGLYDSNDGDTDAHEAQFRFSWQPVAGGINEADWVDAGSETYRAKSTTLIRFTRDIFFPEPGAYAIRIERLNQIDNDTGDQNTGYVTAIRSVRDGALPSHDGIAEVAFRIKATDQLNGQVDSLNAIVQQLAPVLDGNLQWTEPRPVRHPAWGFLQAIRGRHLRRPVRDERIDLAAFYGWAAEEPHWTCDYVIDSATQVGEVLDIIAAAGRAKRTLTDFRWSVIRDGAAGPVRQVFTPRNSWGYSAKLTFPREIHGFRVQARSERLEWQEDEILVLMDGFTRDTATELETLPLPGVVVTADDEDEGNVYRLGRYHLAVALNRPERHSFYADFEHIRVTRGDKIRLVHDVPLIGVGAARIKAITDDGAGNVATILLDDLFDFDQDTFRFSVRNVAGERIFGAISPADPATRRWQPNAPVAVGDIAVGDLVAIEEVTQASAEMLIVGIYPDSDESARIEVVDAVPAILDADTGTIPAYSPVVTQPRDPASDLPPAPAVISAYSNSLTQLVLPDLSVRPRIAVQLAPFVSTATTEGMTLQLRWREDEEGAAWAYGERVDAGEYSLLTGALEEDLPYLGQVRSVGPDGKTRGWVDWPAAVTAGTAPPAPPAIVASAVPASIADADGTARRPAIRLSWVAPTNRTVRVTWQLRVAATGEVIHQGRFAEASETPITLSDGLLPGVDYEIRASFVTGAPDLRNWSDWLPVTAPDLRLTAGDIADELRERIATAFDRHDEVLGDATGTVGELRDAVLSSFGDFGTFGGLPLAEAIEEYLAPFELIGGRRLSDAIEHSIGPLDAPVPLSTRLDLEEQRLTETLPRLYTLEQAGEDIFDRLIELTGRQWNTDQRMAGAGIYVDPESGTVKIEGFEYLQGQVSEVQINLDAALSRIDLFATQAYVDQEIFRAITDPSALPFLDDLTAQVVEVGLSLDAVNGTLEEHAEALTVEGGIVTMTSVTSTLDSLAGEIADRVTNVEFNDATARLSAAEQVIEALPDVATITQSVEASRVIAGDVADLTERSIVETWERFQADEAIRVAEAQARSEQRAYIDEMDRAIAEDVTGLRAEVTGSVTQIRDELRVRASEGEALGESILQISTGLDAVREDVEGNGVQIQGTADALDTLTGQVVQTEEGLVAETERSELMVSSIRDLEDDQEADAERSIVEVWNRWTADEANRQAVAVSLNENRTRVEEGFLAEATARELLGAALADARADIVSERRARATADAALAYQITQVEVSLGGGLASAIEDLGGRVTLTEDGLDAVTQRTTALETGYVDAQDNIAANVAAISGLSARLTQTDEGLVLVSDDVSQLEVRMDATEAETSAQGTAIGGLTTQLAQTEDGLSVVSADVAELGARMTDAETGVSANGTAITQTGTRLTAAEDAITLQGQSLAQIGNQLEDVEAGVVVNADGIGGLTTQLTQTESDVELLAGDLAQLDVRMEETEDQTEAQGTAISGLTAQLTQTGQGLELVAADVSDLGVRMTDAEAGVSANGTVISQHGTRLTDAEGTISAQGQILNQLGNRVTDNETGLSGATKVLDGLTSEVDLHDGQITALAGRTGVIEASIGAGQLVPNGEFLADNLDGWVLAPTGFDVIARGTTAYSAAQNAPTPFMLRSVAVKYSGALIATGLPVQPGRQFRVSFRSAATSGGSAVHAFRFIFRDADGAELTGLDEVRSAASNKVAWTHHDNLGLVTVPAGAVSAQILFRRNSGGTGWGFVTDLRVERLTATETDVRARVETVEATRVTAEEAVAAVNQQISATYGDLEAMAEATAFAEATADGISAGFAWRLNGENIAEAFSVSDGVGGRVRTFRLSPDYVQITGLTQIDQAVINSLAVDNGFIANLTIGRGQISDTLQSDNFVAGDNGSGMLLDFASGYAELNNVKVRRQLEVASGTINVGTFAPAATGTGSNDDFNADWVLSGKRVFARSSPVPIAAWGSTQKTYVVRAEMGGAVQTYEDPDTYWGWTGDVLPLTRWSGDQSLRLVFDFWSRNVTQVENCVIYWKIYEVS